MAYSVSSALNTNFRKNCKSHHGYAQLQASYCKHGWLDFGLNQARGDGQNREGKAEGKSASNLLELLIGEIYGELLERVVGTKEFEAKHVKKADKLRCIGFTTRILPG